MSDQESSAGRLWSYRFSQPGGTVVETGEFTGDDAAQGRGRQLSEANNAPIVVHRHSGHVDGWDYVDEVDERP
jgi:hypothetical protein